MLSSTNAFASKEEKNNHPFASKNVGKKKELTLPELDSMFNNIFKDFNDTKFRNFIQAKVKLINEIDDF